MSERDYTVRAVACDHTADDEQVYQALAQVSGMDKTSMFQKTATARSVAEDGYEAMMAGKIDVMSGLPTSGRIMMSMIPFVPKKMLLKQVKDMQKEV